MATTLGDQPNRTGEAAGPNHQDVCEDVSRIWLPGIIGHIASFLPGNEVAVTLRLVSQATAQQFADRTTIRPAQPVPRCCFASECRRVCRGLTWSKRQQLVYQTAASGDLENLEVAVAETGCPLDVRALMAAAEAGELGMCQWLVGPGRVPWNEDTARNTGIAAVSKSQGHVADWCLKPRAGVNPCAGCIAQVILCALRKGHEGLAWRLIDTHCPRHFDWWEAGRSDVLTMAAAGCSLAGLQRAWEQYTRNGGRPGQGPDPAIANAACSSLDWKEKVEFLLEQGLELPGGACHSVALKNSGADALERLAWLQARGARLSHNALSAAAGKGDAVLVAYLLEQGLKPDRDDVHGAANAGSLEAVKALMAAASMGDLDLDLDLKGMACATAWKGSLPCLSWLVETYGAEAIGGLTPKLFSCASRSGDVERMAWLLARGCGWGEDAWQAAAESGCEAALELLSAQGCPMPDGGGPCLESARMGDVRTMAVLRRLGVPWGHDGGEYIFISIAGLVEQPTKTLPALAWLLANGCNVDWAEAERAAAEQSFFWRRKRHTEVLTWLAEHRPPGPPPPYEDLAALLGT